MPLRSSSNAPMGPAPARAPPPPDASAQRSPDVAQIDLGLVGRPGVGGEIVVAIAEATGLHPELRETAADALPAADVRAVDAVPGPLGHALEHVDLVEFLIHTSQGPHD